MRGSLSLPLEFSRGGGIEQMTLIQFIAQYGYLAVFLGCVIEGESILLLGGYAAHQGYLSLPLVIACAFFGAILGDQFFFLLGRFYGPDLLARHPKWADATARIRKRLEEHHVAVIIGMRFMYGLRTLGPIVIGASAISPVRFMFLNVVGASIWVLLLGGGGYLLGQTLHWFFADMKRYEEGAVLALLAVIVIVMMVRKLIRKRL